jgi:hypothetical protein
MNINKLKINNMKITFWNQKSSAKCRHVAKLKTAKERFEYLLKGGVTAKTWINTETMKEFYRPQLNGITITDGENPFAEYKTVKAAIKEGERLKVLITDYVNSGALAKAK